MGQQKIASRLFLSFFVIGALLGYNLVHARPADCPRGELGEETEDCPWARVTRKLGAAAEAGEPIGPVMHEELPEFFAQLDREGSNSFLLGLWGESINFDEGAKATIVQPEILDFLLSKTLAPPRHERIVHAGIEHTYGYLFSNLRTSFGYKRARWVRDDIEAGFNLSRGMLGPLPGDGGFFTNVTYFVGRIAFRTDPVLAAELQRFQGGATALHRFNFVQLRTSRLVETLKLDGGNRTVTIRTDFVPFLRAPSDPKANSHLLIYSIVDSRSAEGAPRLITAFPVQSSFVGSALNRGNLGEHKPIITRYNAFVEGVTGASGLTGRRELR